MAKENEMEGKSHISVKFFKKSDGRVRKVEFLHPIDTNKCADDNMYDAVASAVAMGYNPSSTIQAIWV